MTDKYESIKLFYGEEEPLKGTMICEIEAIPFRMIQREPLDWFDFLENVKRKLLNQNLDEYARLVDAAIRDKLPVKRGLVQPGQAPTSASAALDAKAMGTADDSVISTLNHLIEACKDSEASFRTVAEVAQSGELQRRFQTYAEQRAAFVSELQSQVRGRGDEPEDSGSAGGAMYRGLTHLKTIVTGNDEGDFLAGCERSEAKAVEEYEAALKQTLPENVREMLEQQYAQLKAVHADIRGYRVTSGE